MTSDSRWYNSPIVYIVFLTAIGWLIGNMDMNTSKHQKVTNRTIINDYPEKSKFAITQPTDSLLFDEIHQDTLVSNVEDTTIIEPIITQNDSLFFNQFISNVKTYDKPVKKAIIRYYKKELDFGKVKILERYGFYIHERPSDIEKTHKSNALYIGDSISNSDILIVSYALMKQGIELKYITESKGHDGWKANAIEVVTDTSVMDNKIITLGYLRDNWGDI